MFVVVKYNKTIEMVNLDNITEIKCDYNNNILVMYKDSGTWANWTLKDRGTLTNAYNLIVDGLLEGKKLITLSEGLE